MGCVGCVVVQKMAKSLTYHVSIETIIRLLLLYLPLLSSFSRSNTPTHTQPFPFVLCLSVCCLRIVVIIMTLKQLASLGID
jgi:hypothetical protein